MPVGARISKGTHGLWLGHTHRTTVSFCSLHRTMPSFSCDAVTRYYYLRQGGYVLPGVCLSVSKFGYKNY